MVCGSIRRCPGRVGSDEIPDDDRAVGTSRIDSIAPVARDQVAREGSRASDHDSENGTCLALNVDPLRCAPRPELPVGSVPMKLPMIQAPSPPVPTRMPGPPQAR